jgi:hypothetical protein
VYSVSGYEISSESREGYNCIADDEKWRVHRTLPAVDLLNIWTAKYARLVDMLVPNISAGPTTGTFHTRAKNQATGEQLVLETGPLEEWCPDMQEWVRGIEDDEARQCSIARWQHVAVSKSHIVAVTC